jgi:hypothetical protein
MSALPPILTVKADIPDRQIRANCCHMHRSKTRSLFDHVASAGELVGKSSTSVHEIAQTTPALASGQLRLRATGSNDGRSGLILIWINIWKKCLITMQAKVEAPTQSVRFSNLTLIGTRFSHAVRSGLAWEDMMVTAIEYRAMGTMSISEGIQKRNAFAAFAAFRIEGLEVSLNHARESAAREELAAVGQGAKILSANSDLA